MITLLRWQVVQRDKRVDLILECLVRPLRLSRCLLPICSGLARVVAVTRRLLRCSCLCVCLCACLCVCACVCACARACVFVCVSVVLFTVCMRAGARAHTHSHRHTPDTVPTRARPLPAPADANLRPVPADLPPSTPPCGHPRAGPTCSPSGAWRGLGEKLNALQPPAAPAFLRAFRRTARAPPAPRAVDGGTAIGECRRERNEQGPAEKAGLAHLAPVHPCAALPTESIELRV